MSADEVAEDSAGFADDVGGFLDDFDAGFDGFWSVVLDDALGEFEDFFAGFREDVEHAHSGGGDESVC